MMVVRRISSSTIILLIWNTILVVSLITNQKKNYNDAFTIFPTTIRKQHRPTTITYHYKKRIWFYSTSKETTILSQSSTRSTSSSTASSSSPYPKKIIVPKTTKQKIKVMFFKAKSCEKRGEWKLALKILHDILRIDPYDSHSHLALARLEARRESSTSVTALQIEDKDVEKEQTQKRRRLSLARISFERGTKQCPKSIHLWQAWALYEQDPTTMDGDVNLSRRLFQKALSIDHKNPYVYHAYGLLELNHFDKEEKAEELWKVGISYCPTAALICSLGELYTRQVPVRVDEAWGLYIENIDLVKSVREKAEIYLAASNVQERYYHDLEKALDILEEGILVCPTDGRVYVAKVKLLQKIPNYKYSNEDKETKRNSTLLSNSSIATTLSNQYNNSTNSKNNLYIPNNQVVKDGRVFNALANMHVKAGRYNKARLILNEGIKQYPNDYTLYQAAGKVYERLGNYTQARLLYSRSLFIQPSAPTLVAYAMLELLDKGDGSTKNITKIQRFFEEALLLDPRHGPAYNAYGTMELQHTNNITAARTIFQRGVRVQCSDPASVYHGYAKLEIREGNIEQAIQILRSGLDKLNSISRSTTLIQRSIFLIHTLGMLEFNCHRISKARQVFQMGLDQYDSKSSQLLLGVALCDVKLGALEQARTNFERSIQSNKKHAHAWQAYGVFEMKNGNLQKAQQLWTRGIKYVPNHGALWLAYAFMESRIGNVDEARRLYATGIQKCPGHVPLYHAWAKLELKKGKFYQAKRLIGEALTRDKSQGLGWLIAAKIEEKLQQQLFIIPSQNNNTTKTTGLVSLILRRGIENAPNDPKLYVELAAYELQRGKLSEARELLQKCINDIDPFYAPSYHALAELEARICNIEGLSNLNKRASLIFSQDYGVMSSSSQQVNAGTAQAAYKMSFSKKDDWSKEQQLLPFVMDDDDDDWSVDPDIVIENMSIFEDKTIGDIFNTRDTNSTVRS